MYCNDTGVISYQCQFFREAKNFQIDQHTVILGRTRTVFSMFTLDYTYKCKVLKEAYSFWTIQHQIFM